MLTRRAFLFSAVSMLSVGLDATLPVRAQDTFQRASSFVKEIGEKLTAVSNSSESDREKRRTFTTTIDNAVDVDGVARFCLGRFWRNASPEQRQRFTQLFHQVYVNMINAKIGEYRGVRFTMGRVQQRDDDTVTVSTVVDRPNNPTNNVDFIVRDPAGAMKIIDIIAENTSLRLIVRQDYASYLSRNNNDVEALINAMQRQVADQQVADQREDSSSAAPR